MYNLMNAVRKFFAFDKTENMHAKRDKTENMHVKRDKTESMHEKRQKKRFLRTNFPEYKMSGGKKSFFHFR